jgi:hypothetical protein
LLESNFCESRENIEIDHIELFKILYDDFIKDINAIPLSFGDNDYHSALFKEDNTQFQIDWIIKQYSSSVFM